MILKSTATGEIDSYNSIGIDTNTIVAVYFIQQFSY